MLVVSSNVATKLSSDANSSNKCKLKSQGTRRMQQQDSEGKTLHITVAFTKTSNVSFNAGWKCSRCFEAHFPMKTRIPVSIIFELYNQVPYV